MTTRPPDGLSPDEVRTLIDAQFPAQHADHAEHAHRITLIAEGGDFQSFVVDGRTVLRFPKDDAGAAWCHIAS
jgi:hypothetical protein